MARGLIAIGEVVSVKRTDMRGRVVVSAQFHEDSPNPQGYLVWGEWKRDAPKVGDVVILSIIVKE